jgi:hypothetical protein
MAMLHLPITSTPIPGSTDGFGAYDEWGPLKEVYVGRADTLRVPQWEGRAGWRQYVSEFQQQLDGLAEAFAQNGVKARRPRPFTEAELAGEPLPAGQGINQAAPADCVWVVGRCYIEMAQRNVLSRKNYLWARDQFLPIVRTNPEALWLACPASRPADVSPQRPGWYLQGQGPYLEGGDIVMVGNGRDVLCGIDETTTDEVGFLWLAQALALDGYKVWPVTFNMIEVHLLAHLNLVAPGLGIICREAFRGHPPLPKPVREWEFIEISPDEVHKGGADVVMLHPRKALVSAHQPRLADELASRGIEPQLVNIRRATEAGAGVRCCTIIIHREPA